MKNKILFISQAQFGYLIDYIQYCKYLKNDFDIKFLCWDYGNKKIEEPDIEVYYISRNGNIIIRNVRFIRSIIKYIKQQKFHLVFINYFRGSSFISLYCKHDSKLHLDIRTGNVSPKKIIRLLNDSILRFESLFFTNISIISNGLRRKLCLNENVYILPLGATPIYVNRKNTNRIHQLYVGTLTYRRLEDTIYGLKLFIDKYPSIDIFYTIIGDGFYNEKENLLKLVNQLELQSHIELTGYITHNELQRYYEKANIGISFIPMTPYYEYQPATKTFEYLMAGLPVIATKTYENQQIVNYQNGILISDNAESFAEGISNIYNRINFFDEMKIRQSVQDYEWENIVEYMKNIILS
jgi:glycosyltransferase involved in cell wall biosynthesis